MSFYSNMISSIIQFGLLVVFATSVSLVNAENLDEQLLSKGMWHDPRTNLIWSRCSLGQQWTGSMCSGEQLKYTWNEAIVQARFARYANRTDWRVPNINELNTITAIVKDEGLVLVSALCTSNTEIGHFEKGHFWSSTAEKSNASFIEYNRFSNYTKDEPCYSTGGDISAKGNKYYVRLVRANN